MKKGKLTKSNGGGALYSYKQNLKHPHLRNNSNKKKLSIVLGRKGVF